MIRNGLRIFNSYLHKKVMKSRMIKNQERSRMRFRCTILSCETPKINSALDIP